MANVIILGSTLVLINPSEDDVVWAAAQDFIKVVIVNPCSVIFRRAMDLMLNKLEIQDVEIEDLDPKLVLGIY